MNYEWLWIMGDYVWWVNMSYWGCQLWLNMNYGWTLEWWVNFGIMGEYELSVNKNNGWIWTIGEYELWVNNKIGEYESWVNINYGWNLIKGEYEFWVNFWIMGELLNHGVTFELRVKFWIVGEILNQWWTFELWSNFWCTNVMSSRLAGWQKVPKGPRLAKDT